MLFAVLFIDKQGQGDTRVVHLKAHIEWVDQHKEQILVAGSLRHEQSDIPKGGLWVVEAQSKEAVFDLISSDPFYTCGLRQSVEVLYWNKALPNHKSVV